MRTCLAVAMGWMVLGLGVQASAMGWAPAPLTLTREGQPAAAIVLSEKPTQAAQFAAFELQWHVKAISGATLPIVRAEAAVPKGYVKLFVGDGPRAQALGLTQDALKLQEYAVRSQRKAIVLVGKDAAKYADVTYDLDALNDGGKNANWPGFWEERGTLNAVYDFLQNACGVRWFNPTDTGALIPHQPTLMAKAIALRRAPTFRYREAIAGNVEGYDRAVSLWISANNKAKDEGFKAWETVAYADSRRRMGNGWPTKRAQATLFLLRMRNGGEVCRANHSLYHYYDLFWQLSKDPAAAKLFVGKKPDLFAQGYQEDPPPQMCYTSTGLVAQVIQEANAYFSNTGYPYKVALCTAPLGPKWGENYFCIEPMDNASFCKCPACQALIAQGTNYGTGEVFSTGIHSDYMFGVVSEVAKEVKKVHPDKHIVTLAYGTHAWLPKTVKLDPSVAVQFCYSTDSWPWFRKEYELEDRLVREWAAEAKVSGRPLYAWCYLGHLARAFSFYGAYNGFPGCLAHSIDREFKQYKQLGYRGMFHCGLPMEVDMYVMFRLMDNADLSVDALLDEYFTGLYGVAGAPLKQLYLDMEKVFADPEVRQGKTPNGGTAQEIDWEYLGTTNRMATYEKLMASARQLATTATDREKRNVELFTLGTWNYMIQGRAQYTLRSWWKQPDRSLELSIPECPLAPEGDLLQATFTNAVAITNWLTQIGTPTARQLDVRFMHDGRFLYADLHDRSAQCSPKDAWELVLALRRELPVYRLRIAADGTCTTSISGSNAAWDSGATAKPMPAAAGTSRLRVSIPLKNLMGSGVEAGWHFNGNVVRLADDGGHAVWLPTIVDAEPVEWLGSFNLAPGVQTVPLAEATLPAVPATLTVAAGAFTNALPPGVTLQTVDAYHLTMATNDLLQGKMMTVGPAGVSWHFQGTSQSQASLGLLSDARTPRTPTEDMFSQGAPEILLTWELGNALPAEQTLQRLRLTWNLGDPARTAVRVKFAVRDAKTQTWTDVTSFIEVPSFGLSENYYRTLDIDLSAKAIAGFDAIRMIDGLGTYNTRFVEVDAVAGPQKP